MRGGKGTQRTAQYAREALAHLRRRKVGKSEGRARLRVPPRAVCRGKPPVPGSVAQVSLEMPCRGVQWLVLLLGVGMCPSVVLAEGDAPVDAGQVCARHRVAARPPESHASSHPGDGGDACVQSRGVEVLRRRRSQCRWRGSRTGAARSQRDLCRHGARGCRTNACDCRAGGQHTADCHGRAARSLRLLRAIEGRRIQHAHAKPGPPGQANRAEQTRTAPGKSPHASGPQQPRGVSAG